MMIEPYKKKSLVRLKRLRGQIDGVIKMIEEGKYCIDIITQTLALQGAIQSIPHLILESHLNTCAAEHLTSKNAKVREKFIKELVRVCELSSR